MFRRLLSTSAIAATVVLAACHREERFETVGQIVHSDSGFALM